MILPLNINVASNKTGRCRYDIYDICICTIEANIKDQDKV